MFENSVQLQNWVGGAKGRWICTQHLDYASQFCFNLSKIQWCFHNRTLLKGKFNSCLRAEPSKYILLLFLNNITPEYNWWSIQSINHLYTNVSVWPTMSQRKDNANTEQWCFVFEDLIPCFIVATCAHNLVICLREQKIDETVIVFFHALTLK